MIVIITKNIVQPKTMDSVNAQGVDWIISGQHPRHKHALPNFQTYLNCAENREAVRHMALASKAQWFLFVDSDIILPPRAWATFMKQIIAPDAERRIIGGWYKIRNSSKWCAGRWVADNVLAHYMRPERSIVRTDFVGLGCAFMSREALTDLHFENGLDVSMKSVEGGPMVLGECGAFANLAMDKGYSLFMDGSVVCGHIE